MDNKSIRFSFLIFICLPERQPHWHVACLENHLITGGEVIRMLLSQSQKGQGLVEYALILILVAVAVIVILAVLGPAIGNMFSNIITLI
jgi:pilus assembly protein Flp/PilA